MKHPTQPEFSRDTQTFAPFIRHMQMIVLDEHEHGACHQQRVRQVEHRPEPGLRGVGHIGLEQKRIGEQACQRADIGHAILDVRAPASPPVIIGDPVLQRWAGRRQHQIGYPDGQGQQHKEMNCRRIEREECIRPDWQPGRRKYEQPRRNEHMAPQSEPADE